MPSLDVYQKIGEECNLTLGSGVVTDVDTLKWVLQPGWNMVGNPYPFSFNLGDVDQTLFCGPLDYVIMMAGLITRLPSLLLVDILFVTKLIPLLSSLPSVLMGVSVPVSSQVTALKTEKISTSKFQLRKLKSFSEPVSVSAQWDILIITTLLESIHRRKPILICMTM